VVVGGDGVVVAVVGRRWADGQTWARFLPASPPTFAVLFQHMTLFAVSYHYLDHDLSANGGFGGY